MNFMKALLIIFTVVFCAAALYFVQTLFHPVNKTVEVDSRATSTKPFPEEEIDNPSVKATSTDTQKIFPSLNNQEMLDRLFIAIKQHGWRTIGSDGNIYEKETEDWHLEFQYQFRSIFLTVLGYPGLSKQLEAEAVLLDTLKLSQEEVCALGVEVYWKNYETEFRIVTKSLTFCAQ